MADFKKPANNNPSVEAVSGPKKTDTDKTEKKIVAVKSEKPAEPQKTESREEGAKAAEPKKPEAKKPVKKAATPKTKAKKAAAKKKAASKPKKTASKKATSKKVVSLPAKTKTETLEKTKMAQKNASTPFDSFAKDAADMSREYSEACVKSSTILMKGMEDIMTTAMSLAQKSAEKQAQFIKEAMGSKTINEFAEVQNKVAQANFDDFMASATKITELSTKVLTESAEPVNAHFGKTIKKASDSIAA